MAHKVIMPKQGLQMTEGTIIRWFKKEGEHVEKDEPLFEMETDKLTISMPAPESGILLKIMEPEGAVVAIAEPIAAIGSPGEDISNILGDKPPRPNISEISQNSRPAAAIATSSDYDVAIIGGGPGGYVCAIRCAQYGKKVVIVEQSDFGGTCLNRGCIPTKALLHSAELYEAAKEAEKLGIMIKEISFDYEKMAANKDKVVKTLRNGVESLLKGNRIEIIRGKARLTGGTGFEAAGKAYRAEKLILAAGSVPASLSVKGADHPSVMNSDDVLAMTQAPKSVTIIGGGVIGIEFAALFCSLGIKVSVVEMLPTILNGQDSDVCRIMESHLQKQGMEIFTNTKLLEIENGKVCICEKDEGTFEIAADQVIVATGRKANSADLDLDAAGIRTEKGFILVDDQMRTNISNIYAIGDLTGKIQLAHVASAQGLVAAANACGKEEKRMRYDVVPACIYTNPEIASVGLTEAQAKKRGFSIVVGTFNVGTNGRSMIMGKNEGLAKIITDQKTGEILGAHLVAPHATDMIAEIAVAMNAEATIEEVADTIHPHPTVSEVIMEAAHDVEGLCCHKKQR